MQGQSGFVLGPVLLAATFAACGGAVATDGAGDAGSGGGPPPVMKLEVSHWLTTGSDKMAMDDLFSELKRHYPGISIVNTNGEPQTRMELGLRITNGTPPDSFQVIVGQDLRSWSDFLEPLDSMAAAQGWATVFPKLVLDGASKNGALLGVPLGIERDNTLFFNKAILQMYGLSAPTTVAEFFSVAGALKSQGVTPLAVSATGGWTIAAHLFESLLVAEAGPDFVEAYFAGQKTADASEVQQALTDLGRMMDYANADRATTGWGTAVKKLCSGEAAMLFLPDFIKNQFKDQGCGLDKLGYVAMEPVGTPTFVFVSLGFPLPKQAPHRPSAIAFLEVAGSAEGQRVFNAAKGSLPARIDVPTQGFDPISQMSMRDLAMSGERVLLGYPAAASSNFQEAVNPALQAFVDPSNAAFNDVAAVLAVLRQNYATIAR